MARIRTVKPEFWVDERLTECSLSARLMFIGTFNFADDNGNMNASPKRLKMQIFPADSLDVETLVDELITHGLLIEYSVSGKNYWHIKGFRKHQKINRPSSTDIPPPEFNEDSVSAHGVGSEDSVTEGKGREGKGYIPETFSFDKKVDLPDGFCVSQRVARWVDEKGHKHIGERLEHFVGYARANGRKYKDWDEALMNSVRNDWANLGGGIAEADPAEGAI